MDLRGNVIALALATALASTPPVDAFVYPSVTRNNVIVRAVVERHADNRKVVIEVDNETTYFRSTECQLDGEKAGRVCPPGGRWLLENLPAGEYTVKATLYGTGGSVRAVDTKPLRVIGMEGVE